MKICGSCGNQNSDTALFCCVCGTKLENEEPVVAETAAAGYSVPEETYSAPEETNSAAEEVTPVVETSYSEPQEEKQQQPVQQFVPVYQNQNTQSNSQNMYNNQTQSATVNGNNASDKIDPKTLPEEYQPVSMWGFFGYILLFGIPIAGFILMIVFACGVNRKKNVTNLARGYLLVIALVVIIYIVLIIIFVAVGVSLYGMGSHYRYNIDWDLMTNLMQLIK